MLLPLATALPSQLFIYTLLRSESLAQSLLHLFLSRNVEQAQVKGYRYLLTQVQSEASLLDFIEHPPSNCDCIIVQDEPDLLKVVEHLYQQGMLFPVVVLKTDSNNFFEHPSVVEIDISKLSYITEAIEQAIAQFLNLPIAAAIDTVNAACERSLGENGDLKNQSSLGLRQLDDEVRDDSCYILGFSKRNQTNFFQQMSPVKQEEFLQQIKADYRYILINYFGTDTIIKQKIDKFINTAFVSNIPVTKIIEIHMEIIDEFSKQLQLEGRNDDLLSDYRLTLIDILAHLCEIYRCSTFKEL